jgi:hypothetical protein
VRSAETSRGRLWRSTETALHAARRARALLVVVAALGGALTSARAQGYPFSQRGSVRAEAVMRIHWGETIVPIRITAP